HAAVDQRFDVVWLDRDRPVETDKRLVETVQTMKQASAIVERVRGVRIDIGRFADQALRFFEPASLVADDAEPVQGVEMAGLAAQNLAVNLRGLIQSARALQAKRALEQCLAHPNAIFISGSTEKA